MVHENDKGRGGCEFGTAPAPPQGLLGEGIYSDIAIALRRRTAPSASPWAQALGATEDGTVELSSCADGCPERRKYDQPD